MLKVLVGHRLRAAREILARQSQQDLATNMGIGRSALNNYENGYRFPDPIFLGQFCDQYGCTADWLYRGVALGLPPEFMGAMIHRYNEIRFGRIDNELPAEA